LKKVLEDFQKDLNKKFIVNYYKFIFKVSMNKYKKGFTLIELLVVVAIIGILASVVLASLSSARNKGKDAAVQSEMASMRAQAQLYTGAGTAISIGTNCAASAGTIFDTANLGLGNLLTPVISAEGSPSSAGTLNCFSNAFSSGTAGTSATWSIAAKSISSPSGIAYCVDSTGASNVYTGTSATAYSGTLSAIYDGTTGLCK